MKVFWSYAKRDDAKPHHVTQLRKQFEIVLSQCIGDDVELFQDTTGLKWGDNWRSKLESEVKNSDAFVCILSPSYFNSKMCIQEVVWATEAGINIDPILYRACPKGFKSSFADSDSEAVKLNVTSEQITSLHQYVDFTSLRNLSKEGTKVMIFLDKVCEQIA
jgi:hypothetical protein